MKNRKVFTRCAAATLGLAVVVGPIASATAAPIDGAAESTSTVLNVGANESERNLVWYSSSSNPQAARIAVKGNEANTTRTVLPVKSGAAQAEGQTYYQATFSDLAASTTYTYQVGSDVDGWSESYEFSTQTDGDFDFLVYGDPQIGSGGGQPTDGGAWQNTLTTSTSKFPGADFLLSVGDQVNTHDDAAEYADFLAPDQLRENALATNVGNHDVGPSYGEHFFMPNSDPVAGAQHPGLGNYWYVYNDVLFLSLNSNVRDNQQHFDWMEQVIAEHGQDAKWKVATWHHALYSTASHSTDSDVEARRTDMPLEMSKLDIDLVLSGHDHVYTRSHLLHSGHAVGDLSAPSKLEKFPGEVLYMSHNSSTGSKYYQVTGMDYPFNAITSQERTPSYTHVTVTDESLRAVTYQVADGKVLDDVTLSDAPEGATPNPVPDYPAETVFEPEPVFDEPIAPVVDEKTGEVTAQARILTGNDDIEQYVATGEVYLDSSDLEVTEESPGEADTEQQIIGLRYDRLAIPAGAKITSAHLQFTTDEPKKSADPFNVAIAVENSADSLPFKEEDNNLSSRSFLDTTVEWKDIPLWTLAQEAGPDQRTPDLSALIQSIVDGEGWEEGNALTLALSGTGNRTAEAYEGGSGAEAPILWVTYEMPAEPEKKRGKSADAPGHNKDTMHDRGRSHLAPGHNK
ncbi:metallophosphoesterase family protein [Arthrobacter sp. CAU 1506]|uniref:purple acid phosphatase family protein n=1 Tax=Arthrobacter sp. CAU 1506 TaxID=2560052 RepID=UPI0010AC0F65|nr:metallophosphoesterase family protein [Arthrobacter sp. CAU 1506]TJY69190.1 metallophosphoesterase family protein [Arthrobacter sp. CAU 1506]